MFATFSLHRIDVKEASLREDSPNRTYVLLDHIIVVCGTNGIAEG